MDWRDLKTESLGVGHFHVDGLGRPVYPERYDEVLSFHAPGLAPVMRGGKAFYITATGEQAFRRVFRRAYGFYEGAATVEDDEGFFHITTTGQDLYRTRYAWCGNFQGGRCPVCDMSGAYFHIDRTGHPAYLERYAYVGDFSYGVAVVCSDERGATHIREDGTLLHGVWFCAAMPYHKGMAVVKDGRGWFHVDSKGNALYDERYSTLEPYYNGRSLATDREGKRVLIFR